MSFTIKTEFPVAFDSPDHIYPWGTANDNTSHPGFVEDIQNYFQQKEIFFMDLGCSGGQLVKEFLDAGAIAIGLEGSDYSIQHNRANWPELNNKNLFTCDISQPYQILFNNNSVKFDCISAWEVVEHIKTDRLDQFFENIFNHLNDKGIFCCSISTVPDPHGEIELHQTVWSKEKWLEYFVNKGYKYNDAPLIKKRVREEGNSFQIDLFKN